MRNVVKATQLLRQAIELHERHMNGTAPVTGRDGDKSQMQMMTIMRSALAELTGDSAPRGLLSMQGME